MAAPPRRQRFTEHTITTGARGRSTPRTWSAEAPRSGSGTVFDVLAGLFGELPVGSGLGETCAIHGSPTTSLRAGSAPAPGAGFYYLVRGKNACGVGTYGLTSAGPERTSVDCP